MTIKLNWYSRAKQFKAIMPPSLHPGAKYLLCVMYDFAREGDLGNIFASNKTLIDAFGASRATFFRHMKELRDRGFIVSDEDAWDTSSKFRPAFRIDAEAMAAASLDERGYEIDFSLKADLHNLDREERKGERPKSRYIRGLSGETFSREMRPKSLRAETGSSLKPETPYKEEPPLKENYPFNIPPTPHNGGLFPVDQKNGEISKAQIVMEEALSAWNALAPSIGLAQCTLTKSRRPKLGKLLKEFGMSGWLDMLTELKMSDFLRGKNTRKWRADIDFILKPGKFERVMEGGYRSHGVIEPKAVRRNMFDLDLPPLPGENDYPNVIDGEVS